MIKIIFSSVLMISVNLYSQSIHTPLQKSDYKRITSHAELSEYIKIIDEKSSLISSEVLTKSVEGRELYVIRFSDSEFGKDETKIKVLIFAQQHGNEQSGKEGALLLINELLKPENQYLFERIDFALVPQMNPDGSEKNQRRNGNDADLNRNHLTLTEPETIALHKLFTNYLFEVSMDVHEYFPYGETWKSFGYRNNADEEVGAVTNINVSSKIRELAYKKYLPFIKKYFNERNISFFEYSPGGPPEIDYIRRSTYDINDGRQSMGIQNTLSFIQEGLNGEDGFVDNIKHRAEAQMTGMRGLLEFVYQNKDEIKNIVAVEREKLIFNKVERNVAIQLDHFADGSKLELPLYSYYSGNDTLVIVNDYRPVVKATLEIQRPAGYLIPKDRPELAEWIEKHDIKYTEAIIEKDDVIEQYMVDDIDSIDFERDIIVNPIVSVKNVKQQVDISNYFYIPVNQIKNNIIVIALEPKSMLAIVTYKKYEHLLKKGEAYPILRVIK